ncbi:MULTISPECIES: hypothetical protein [Arthrobacter]|uniref:Uncharacterized protein n=1 Tax=Arthrobacter terricola TaxID=2547396 RepID=A0A4R5K5F3_9MICC|nr:MULTISPECIES: hypothetical protein [Arthrobacter]MBT8163083.1 hypothetical protein [Arthrobacter sp. GN70]TDF88123.1 hypothetical protein E1809_24190 [Arthrobacter terricola]
MKAAALEDNDWIEDAIATIDALSLAHSVFTADDLRREMRPPAHKNWPGQALAQARKEGLIVAVGYQISMSKSRKHGVTRAWARKTNREVTPCSTASTS